jgi:hypothetical protein
MAGDLTVSDGDDRLPEGMQQEPAEESDGHRLPGARERQEQAEVQSRRHRYERGEHENASGPAMKLEEPAAYPRRELERRQKKKKSAGDDVEQRRREVGAIPPVEARQVRSDPRRTIVAADASRMRCRSGSAWRSRRDGSPE